MEYLDFTGLGIYNNEIKKYISRKNYNKAEVDNLIASVESGVIWKDAVETYDDLAVEYPYPQLGWTAAVLDVNKIYRYNGEEWVAINNTSIPIATTENDGQMAKEMVQQLEGLGTASEKNYVVEVDSSDNLPTSNAVNTRLASEVQNINISVDNKLSTKANIDDLGTAAPLDAIDEIPEEVPKFYIKGSYYSMMDETIDLLGYDEDSFIHLDNLEDMNDYIVHFGMVNYATPVDISLHFYGTKDGEPIDAEYREGEMFTLADVPDEYISGEESPTVRMSVVDYHTGDVRAINVLSYPYIHDDGNDVDIPLAPEGLYEEETEIYVEYVDEERYAITAKFGTYVSSDLPTASAVSILVNAVKLALTEKITEVEGKVDDIHDADDEEIDSWFDF